MQGQFDARAQINDANPPPPSVRHVGPCTRVPRGPDVGGLQAEMRYVFRGSREGREHSLYKVAAEQHLRMDVSWYARISLELVHKRQVAASLPWKPASVLVGS